MSARVRGRDDGQVAAQRGFDVLVEVVGVVVREEDGVDVREVVEVEGRVREAGAGYAGPEVDVVAGVEEVGLWLGGWLGSALLFELVDWGGYIGHYAHALPFSGLVVSRD